MLRFCNTGFLRRFGSFKKTVVYEQGLGVFYLSTYVYNEPVGNDLYIVSKCLIGSVVSQTLD
jgi:hypothetical protein